MPWNFDYASTGEISRIMGENSLSMSKKFGQNFLINTQALDRIVTSANLEKGSRVWEVGPGLGALTSRLVLAGCKVTAFEIDHGFCKILREQAFKNDENFTLVEGDALKNWKEVFEKDGTPDAVVANLPYNVGSVFIASLIENRCLPKTMVYTLQSEVVKRMCSGIGDDQYSGFSILTSIDYENTEVMKLKSGCFWPAPNVDSSVVKMTKRTSALVSEELAPKFIANVRVLFAQRRKTVKNNLKALGLSSENIEKALSKAGIDPLERAEKLTVDQICALTEALSDYS